MLISFAKQIIIGQNTIIVCHRQCSLLFTTKMHRKQIKRKTRLSILHLRIAIHWSKIRSLILVLYEIEFQIKITKIAEARLPQLNRRAHANTNSLENISIRCIMSRYAVICFALESHGARIIVSWSSNKPPNNARTAHTHNKNRFDTRDAAAKWETS